MALPACLLVVAVGICVAPSRAAQRWLFILLAVSLTVYPKTLVNSAVPYVGIATKTPTVASYTVILGVLLVSLFVAAPRIMLRSLTPWLPFVLVAGYECATHWPHDSLTTSGCMQIGAGIVAFIVSATLMRRGVITTQVLFMTILAIVGIETVFALSDVANHPLYQAHGPQATDLAGRVIGTADHPDQLAKLMLLSIAGLLVHAARSARERRLQAAGVLTSLAVIGLAQSRAAFVAALAGIAFAVLLDPRRELRRARIYMLVGVFIVAGVASGALIARFQQDPTGGARGYLTSLALRVIHSHFDNGVGINHYVATVGLQDALTASGVPVHDMFLLSVGEMGIFAGSLLWLPFLLIAVIAVTRCRRSDQSGLAARAFLFLFPGLLFTGLTGWGLLQAPTFEIFGLILGVIWSNLVEAPAQVTEGLTRAYALTRSA